MNLVVDKNWFKGEPVDPIWSECNAFEEKVYNYFKSLVGDAEVEFHNRNTIESPLEGKLELDIYFPDLKLAVEVNSIKYHAEKRPYFYLGTYLEYHAYKTLMCKVKGIMLIHVWDYQWDDCAPVLYRDLQIREQLKDWGVLKQ